MLIIDKGEGQKEAAVGRSQQTKAKDAAPTWAAELALLHLCHIEAPKAGGSRALGEEPNGGPLSQPLREPAQVTVTEQMVGVQAARGGERLTTTEPHGSISQRLPSPGRRPPCLTQS